MQLLILAALFGLMYVLLILPQQRKLKQHQNLVEGLEVGDDVMTTAGVYGTIRGIDGDTVSLEVAPGVVLTVAKGSIGEVAIDDAVLDDDSTDEEPAADESADDELADEPADDER